MTRTFREFDRDVDEDIEELHHILNSPDITIDKEMSMAFSYISGRFVYQKYLLFYDDPRLTIEDAIKKSKESVTPIKKKDGRI